MSDLSKKTLLEMNAGIEQLRKNGVDLKPNHLKKMVRSRERRQLLDAWIGSRKVSKVPIEELHGHVIGIRVGDQIFYDDEAALAGSYPSEVLIANLALALGAGVGMELGP